MDRRRKTQKDSRSSKDTKSAKVKRLDTDITDPRELVVVALLRMQEGAYSNIIWDILLRGAQVADRDKTLATRIFYGTISNMRYLDALWNSIDEACIERADESVRAVLRMSLYQILFLDRVPNYSIVSSAVDIVKRIRNRSASGFCNALLRKATRIYEAEGALEFAKTGDDVVDFAIRYSLSDDLARLLLTEFPEDALELAQSMQAAPMMSLRLNHSKISLEAWLAMDLNIEASQLLPKQAFNVKVRDAALEAAMQNGFVHVQDTAAQLAVHAMGAPETWASDRQDITIWDACAGQGGKSLHLIDRILATTDGRNYKLVSTDLYAKKLERLRDYQKSHFPKAELITKVRDLSLPGSVVMAPFDAVILDAPCSGLGVMHRHPEAKLTRTIEEIQSLVELQKILLDNVCVHVRKGGRLVYAVCTIVHAECEEQRQNFLDRHPNFVPAPMGPDVPLLSGQTSTDSAKLLPHRDGCDGFYIACFKRVS